MAKIMICAPVKLALSPFRFLLQGIYHVLMSVLQVASGLTLCRS